MKELDQYEVTIPLKLIPINLKRVYIVWPISLNLTQNMDNVTLPMFYFLPVLSVKDIYLLYHSWQTLVLDQCHNIPLPT